ncbi:unnamed protein product [Paramecium primaurelia]|uniref:Uncharacterized protein n=2 Tax=Paramecium TaxID=5884 RepID=A0A8S1VAP1_9CILI|nr:unnamed protein product [Paramecium primaurelia]CAD8173917.1 unnamed protein product [Paramecium pentaurelia]
MKTKDIASCQIPDNKQQLLDIYLLTFYKKPSIQPIPVNQQSTQRKLSIKRKAGSVKEILQEYAQPNKDHLHLQPLKQNQFQRVLSQNTRCQDFPQEIATERPSLSKSKNKRYKSVNLTKKFQYLHQKIEPLETTQNINQYQSYRINCNPVNNNFESKWKSQFNQLEQLSQNSEIYPQINNPSQNKVLHKKLIFPKEFSTNGLYKKYFA